MDWFRWWHGTVTDPKFKAVARLSGQPLAHVLAVWAALLEHASNVTLCNDDVTRGDVTNVDCNALDAHFDFSDGVVQSILDALKERRMVVDGRIASWQKRQPKKEDSSVERVRKYREKKQKSTNNKTKCTDVNGDSNETERPVTPCNDGVTLCNAPEKIRLEKIREENNTHWRECDAHAEKIPIVENIELPKTHPAEKPSPRFRDKFPMTLDWQPSKSFPDQCFMRQVDATCFTPDVIHEFKTWWADEPGRTCTQSQWEIKLITRVKQHHTGPSRGLSHANHQRSDQQPKSALERRLKFQRERDAREREGGHIIDLDAETHGVAVESHERCVWPSVDVKFR